MESDGLDPNGRYSALHAIWLRTITSTPREVREAVSHIVSQHADHLSSVFYDRLLEVDDARRFLNPDIVNRRLHASMARWARQVFETLTESQLPAAIARQIAVGNVHARIKLPPELMQIGVLALSAELRRLCQEAIPERDHVSALIYVSDIFLICDSLILSSFIGDVQTSVRKEEAYRLISMEHDVALERERQRAALSEWMTQFLVSIGVKNRRGLAGTLASSEFGLWMNHKARVFFDGLQDLDHVFDVIRSIDEIYVPQLEAGSDNADQLIVEFEKRIEFIRYLIGDMFGRMSKMTLGRDSVTRLLNLRYLPTILTNETRRHAQDQKKFSLILVKVDAWRKATPVDDHEGRDLVLQQMAVAIIDTINAGDHGFRYAEDQFLIVLVETDEKAALARANDLRLRIRAMEFHLRGRALTRLTVSIGVSEFDGHPDFQHLVRRAENAALTASGLGGDQVAVE